MHKTVIRRIASGDLISRNIVALALCGFHEACKVTFNNLNSSYIPASELREAGIFHERCKKMH